LTTFNQGVAAHRTAAGCTSVISMMSIPTSRQHPPDEMINVKHDHECTTDTVTKSAQRATNERIAPTQADDGGGADD
jgi:hypothetical protein